MHQLCCVRRTKHQKPKKTRETSRNLTSDDVFLSGHEQNHSSDFNGLVKESSLKEGTRVASLLPNRISREEEQSSASVLRDRSTLSTFGKAVPREMPSLKQDLTDSFNSDYDNTTYSTDSNNISSADVVPLLLGKISHSKASEGECGVIANTTTPNSLLFPAETNLSFPVQTSHPSEADQANIDLDLVMALMNSMVSTDDNSHQATPAPLQRSSPVPPRRDQHEALKPPEDLTFVRRHTNITSSVSSPNDISTENTSVKSSNSRSLFSQSNRLNRETSDDDQFHSAVFRRNSSSELLSDSSVVAAETSRCLSQKMDKSQSQVSASQVLPTATKVKDNNTTTGGLDNSSVPEEAKDSSDSGNLDKLPQRRVSSGSLLSGISMQTETVQEATKRTSRNKTFSENVTEDSILTSGQSITSEPNCFIPDIEKRLWLTSSQEKVASVSPSVSLVGDVSMRPLLTPEDHFKAMRLDVLKATSKLLDFVREIWRKEESWHGKLSEISLLCLHLKTGLQALENFGLGLVSYLSEEERHTSEKKLFSQVKLLQNIGNGINRYLKSLEKETVSEHSELSQQGSDDERFRVKIGNIILLTKVIPGLVRSFGSFVDDVVKANVSCRNVVISELYNYFPSDKNLTDFSHDSSPPVHLTYKRNFSDSHIKENPPAIPSNLFQAAKTIDKKMLRHNTHVSPGNGVDHLRAAVGCETSAEGTNLTAVSLCNNDNTVKPVTGQSTSSFPGEPLTPQSKTNSHLCFVANDALEDDGSWSSMEFRRKSPISPAQNSIAINSNDAVDGCLENRLSTSKLVTPDIRASGISLTVQTKLEELQRQATSHGVLLHTDADCSFMDYDLPAGIMEENLPNLCESDCKLLLYYSDEMFIHWKVLDSAALAFFQFMENSQFPKIFIMHSKFVIVAGHKMAYIGDVLARNVRDIDARHWLLAYSNDLCDRLKHAVRKTKEAALTFPAVVSLQSMVDAIKDVTDSAYELRELLFRLAYLGKAEQTISW